MTRLYAAFVRMILIFVLSVICQIVVAKLFVLANELFFSLLFGAICFLKVRETINNLFGLTLFRDHTLKFNDRLSLKHNYLQKNKMSTN